MFSQITLVLIEYNHSRVMLSGLFIFTVSLTAKPLRVHCKSDKYPVLFAYVVKYHPQSSPLKSIGLAALL